MLPGAVKKYWKNSILFVFYYHTQQFLEHLSDFLSQEIWKFKKKKTNYWGSGQLLTMLWFLNRGPGN